MGKRARELQEPRAKSYMYNGHTVDNVHQIIVLYASASHISRQIEHVLPPLSIVEISFIQHLTSI